MHAEEVRVVRMGVRKFTFCGLSLAFTLTRLACSTPMQVYMLPSRTSAHRSLLIICPRMEAYTDIVALRNPSANLSLKN